MADWDQYTDVVPDMIEEVRITLSLRRVWNPELAQWDTFRQALYRIVAINAAMGQTNSSRAQEQADVRHGSLQDSNVATIVNASSITLAALSSWVDELEVEAATRILPP